MPAAISARGLSKTYRVRTSDRGDGNIAYRTMRDELSYGIRAMLPGGRKRGYRQVAALNDVSFELEQGHVLGILGENGAGKTTLLRVLAGITPPTSGEAAIRGRVGTMLEVGTGFHPELTGRENVFLSGAILGMRRAEVARRFDEIVDYAGVTGFIDEPLKHYSSGMQARLAFAVLAHLEPEILFVDEVLAVGDLVFQAKSFSYMKSLASRGVAVVFVSHNLQALTEISDSGLMLVAGNVAAEGSIGAVIGAYRQHLGQLAVTSSADSGTLDATLLLDGAPLTRHVRRASNDRFEFDLRLATPDRLHGAYLNMHVVAADGRHVLHLRSDVTAPPMDLAPGRHSLGLTIDELPLAPGTYLLSFRLVSADERNPAVWDSQPVLLEIEGEHPLDTFMWPRHEFTHEELSDTR